MNLKFNHKSPNLHNALGITDERSNQLRCELCHVIDEEKKKTTNIPTSRVLELILAHVENPLEQAWLIYEYGMLTGIDKMKGQRGISTGKGNIFVDEI